MRNPFESTGVVVRRDGASRSQFAGTCFAISTSAWFITAAHVVKDLAPEDLGITLYIASQIRGDEGLDVRAVFVHPEADIALLHAPDAGLFEVFDPFHGIDPGGLNLGDPIRCFGFPSETVGSASTLVPRMLRGYVQRRFRHESLLGYKYGALELSNSAPAGLSGAPISLDGDPSRVVGVVAESFESRTLLHEVSEVERDGTLLRESVHALITYGVGVDLRFHAKWLNEIVKAG